MDTAKSNNLLELPQLMLSFLIIMGSLIMAIFLVARISIPEPPTRPEPTRYERLLVQLYSTARDRTTIRFIEAKITPERLALFDDDEQKSYKERYWEHFKENPIDYWFFSSTASVGTMEPMLAVVVEEREGELINIIKNRDQYIAETNEFSYLYQPSGQEKIIPVQLIIERAEQNIAIARDSLNTNNPDLAVIALNEVKFNLSTYNLVGSNQEALSNLFFLKPRYKPIVYGCFNPNSNLYDVAKEIIADKDEDLTLRLTSVNYLLSYISLQKYIVKEKDTATVQEDTATGLDDTTSEQEKIAKEQEKIAKEQEEIAKQKQKILEELLALFEKLNEGQSTTDTVDDYAESVVRLGILTVLEELR